MLDWTRYHRLRTDTHSGGFVVRTSSGPGATGFFRIEVDRRARTVSATCGGDPAPGCRGGRLAHRDARPAAGVPARRLARRVEQHLPARLSALHVLVGPAHVRERVGLAHLRHELPARGALEQVRQRLLHHVPATRGSASARSRRRRGSFASAARSRPCSARGRRSRRPRSGRTARARSPTATNTRPPDISSTTSTPFPPLASIRAALRSSTAGSTTASAPSDSASARFSSVDAVAITRPAPNGLAELHRQRTHPAGAGDHHSGLARGELGGGPEQVPRGDSLDQQRECRAVLDPVGDLVNHLLRARPRTRRSRRSAGARSPAGRPAVLPATSPPSTSGTS